jgi:hypothetical protein
MPQEITWPSEEKITRMMMVVSKSAQDQNFGFGAWFMVNKFII